MARCDLKCSLDLSNSNLGGNSFNATLSQSLNCNVLREGAPGIEATKLLTFSNFKFD